MSEGSPEGTATGTGEPAASSGFMGVVLEDALAANGLESWPVEGYPGVLTGSVEGTFGQWNYFAQPDDEALGVVIYSVFPGNVAASRRQAVAELIARANYLLRYGSLEMDFSDGEVRARTSARGGPEALDFHVIAELVRTNFEVAELFFPAVREVAMDGHDPALAVSSLLARLGGS
ncbi:MAG: YbjN domain-containing protein [Acidimicrobiales bacterium]